MPSKKNKKKRSTAATQSINLPFLPFLFSQPFPSPPSLTNHRNPAFRPKPQNPIPLQPTPPPIFPSQPISSPPPLENDPIRNGLLQTSLHANWPNSDSTTNPAIKDETACAASLAELTCTFGIQLDHTPRKSCWRSMKMTACG